MLVKRVLVALVLLPMGLALIAWGGAPYYAFIALILALAAWEYVQLFRAGGHRPAGALVMAGVLSFVVGRAWTGFAQVDWMASLFILAGTTVHLVAYERGRDQAATDFSLTLLGGFYIGFLGAYFISLRDLPEGNWWLLVVLPAVWLADSAAYFVGTRFGRHKLCPRLSPKKTWEGYLAGIVISLPATAGLCALWQVWAGPGTAITPERGALIALVLSAVTTLGDLGESMIKRQLGVKDSGKLLPGHGGALDRIDSWLWGAVIGYYIIVWFF